MLVKTDGQNKEGKERKTRTKKSIKKGRK